MIFRWKGLRCFIVRVIDCRIIISLGLQEPIQSIAETALHPYGTCPRRSRHRIKIHLGISDKEESQYQHNYDIQDIKQMGYLSTQPHLHQYHTASATVSRQPAHAPQSLYRHRLGSSILEGSRSRMTRIGAIKSGAHAAQLGTGIVGGRGRTIRLGGGWLVMESLSITTRQLRSSNGGWGRTHRHIVGGGRDRRNLGLLGAFCPFLHGLVARPVGDHHAADGEDGEDANGEEEEPIGHGS